MSMEARRRAKEILEQAKRLSVTSIPDEKNVAYTLMGLLRRINLRRYSFFTYTGDDKIEQLFIIEGDVIRYLGSTDKVIQALEARG